MTDAFEDTSLFRRFKATPSMADPLADKRQAQAVFDEVLSPLGVRAPGPEPKESDGEYLARLGEHAAVFGPDERKGVNRYALPSAALAAFVNEDLEIARQEVEKPNHTLKYGVLTERKRQDASGRPIIEFYSKSGPSVWMDTFKDPSVKYVSGGSNGITTTDTPRPPTHDFMKSRTVPELVELQKQMAYRDSAEFKIIEAYKAAGKRATGQSSAISEQIRERNMVTSSINTNRSNMLDNMRTNETFLNSSGLTKEPQNNRSIWSSKECPSEREPLGIHGYPYNPSSKARHRL